jgi:hypothetical protein
MQTDHQNSDSAEKKKFTAAKDDVAKTLKSEAQSATDALHDARDEVTRKAGEYASEAKTAAFAQAERGQRDIGESLAAFGGALRAASEHLANSDQRTISKMMLEAAGGVERLSGSLKTQGFEETLNEVRAFGRKNSGALFAGSMLAGLALGRIVKSSAPESGSMPPQSRPDPGASENEQGPEDAFVPSGKGGQQP